MLKALGLGKRGGDMPTKPLNNSTVSLAIMDDALRVEEAFIAMDMVMDDRSKEALKLIQKDEPGSSGKSVAREQSAFYKLVIGVIYFIEATLGFEPESIRRASEALAEAEAAAVRQKRNVSNNGAHVSYSKYPPGTEYRVAFAEAELMGAITLFLSESYLESVKALYKLRKAYQTLDEISKSIRESKKPAKSSDHKSTLDSLSLAVSDDQEMASLVEKFQKTRLNRLNESNNATPVASSAASMNTTTSSATALHQGSETIEEFIESGVDLCFGILQLVISIIPPHWARFCPLLDSEAPEMVVFLCFGRPRTIETSTELWPCLFCCNSTTVQPNSPTSSFLELRKISFSRASTTSTQPTIPKSPSQPP